MRVHNETTLIMNGEEKIMLRTILQRTTKSQMDEIESSSANKEGADFKSDKLIRFIHKMIEALEAT